MAEHEFKVGDKVYSDVWQSGEVVKYEPETGYYLVDVGGQKVWSHKAALRKAVHQFQVGDQVAHIHKGNGVIEGFEENSFGKMWPVVRLDNGCKWKSHPDRLRPRNFLAKIAEEQDYPKTIGDMIKRSLAEKTVDQQFNEVFITDAYGIKRDPVTLLEIESDGLVKISSIRDSVREIS